MKKFLKIFIIVLIVFNKKAFSSLSKDSVNLSNTRFDNKEINDLFNARLWDFKEFIVDIENFTSLNKKSDFLINFASEILKKRDFVITEYLSKEEETCQNLGKIKKYLEIRFNMWVVQAKLLPLLKDYGLSYSYNQEKNRLERIK